MGVKGVYPPPSTIMWLRDYLTENGTANPYGFYKYLTDTAGGFEQEAERLMAERRSLPKGTERSRVTFSMLEATREARRWSAVSYDSVRRVFYMCNRLGLIEFAYEEPADRGGDDRRYYRIVPGMYDQFQGGLQRVLWPASYWGGTRYRTAKRLGRVAPEKKI